MLSTPTRLKASSATLPITLWRMFSSLAHSSSKGRVVLSLRSLVLAVLVAFLLASLSFAPAQDKKDDKKKDDKTAGAYFEVYKDKGDEFRFRLKDGDTLLAISGKGYKTKADVDKVIDAI